MERKTSDCYRLDSSAIIYLASVRKGYTNLFRITATLTEVVYPEILQRAVNRITPRFPTIAAGIQREFFRYIVVPLKVPPQVQPDQEYLSGMTRKEIETCAVRILYSENHISVECFHALTDGYGCSVFFNTLLAEYFSILYSIPCRYTEQILNPHDDIDDAEIADDYINFIEKSAIPSNDKNVYHLPDTSSFSESTHVTTGVYCTQELLNVAHDFGVSLTVFLTAVMFDAVMKLQSHHGDQKKSDKTIQIMIPINLRKQFPSKTLRNFTFYALPHTTQQKIPFEILVHQVAEQMKVKTSRKYLSAMISTNVRCQRMLLFRILPLSIKNAVSNLIYYFYGERRSCLSISNLGEIIYPKEIEQYIQQVDFSLTPRRDSLYNCGIVSHNGHTFINFTRKSGKTELEQYFFEKLAEMGCRGIIE